MKKEEPICEQCGLCCHLFLINLNEKEYRGGRYRLYFDDITEIDDFELAKNCGANILRQNPDGSCTYLVDNSCSIHEHRPEVCRDFFCKGTERKFVQMRREIAAAKNS